MESNMIDTIVNKSKWFWAWQDDKEEEWLGQMAKQGLYLEHPGPFGQYSFSTGKPRGVVYRLDFVPSNKKDEAYFQLFRDAGWEHAGEMMGWQYWRKEVKPGETPEIFTDVESKIQKYRRLLGFLAIVFLPVAMGLFNMRNFSEPLLASGSWIEWLYTGIMALIFAVFILYIFIFIRLWIRIRQLQRL
jgi:Protein of unknown function (DUF2812)